MSTVNLNIRTEKEIKANAEKIFEALGLNMSSAINIFLRRVIQENGLPFELKLNAPLMPDESVISDAATNEKETEKETDKKDSWVFDVNT